MTEYSICDDEPGEYYCRLWLTFHCRNTCLYASIHESSQSLNLRRSDALTEDEEYREERNTMGDKGKKDKTKGQKQNTEKQQQKDKKKADKQPKKVP
jgi:hypothetical protein